MIGVLNLQGDVREHVAALDEVGAESQLVKRPADLSGLSGLILPGGESTTLSMLLTSTGLFDALAEKLASGFPVFGTCAGLVLLASEVLDGRPDQRFFGVLPVTVRRNGFGRQVASFEDELEVSGLESAGAASAAPAPAAVGAAPTATESPPAVSMSAVSMRAVFIRAPMVVGVGDGVEVMATVSHAEMTTPVLVRYGSVLAASFHPELTPDRRLHGLFAAMCGIAQ